GPASGTMVVRCGTNTSCTRAIGRPKNWSPIVAVTYSTTDSLAAFMDTLSRRASEIGGLLLQSGDQSLLIELGYVVIKPHAPAALDRLRRNQRRQADDRQVGGAGMAVHCRAKLEAVHAGHLQIGDH